jgi:superfamily II DNA or RNA helicase
VGRFDGGDLKTEGLFGPVVVNVDYTTGVEVGALVPITVYFVRCPEPSIGLKMYQGYKTRHKQIQRGIELNNGLNDLVADIVHRIPDDMQTMLIMQHQLQLNELKRRLPEVVDVHGTRDANALTGKGFFDLTPVKAKDRARIYEELARADIMRVMATYIYKQGVNFPSLEVMICPGGGGSKLVAGQIPGRASRRIDGKDTSYIIDFWHPWDTIDVDPIKNKRKDGPLLRDDKSRDKVYKNLGFKRVWVDTIDDLPFLTGSVEGLNGAVRAGGA